jgi:hypothetical protein
MSEESTVVAKPDVPLSALPAELMEQVVIGGDLSGLNPAQRAEYYGAVCRSLGLNPLTKPFEYLQLNGKLRLYALRDCADQLRRIHGISIYITNRENIADVYVVTARAKDRSAREDESTGVVTIGHLKGDALANAFMKAETKAKRRVTLSIAGLGWLDETELDTIPRPGSDERRPKAAQEHPTKEQMESLQELAHAVDIEEEEFWQQMRRMLDIALGVKISKKGIRDQMSMSQYEAAETEYRAHLKQMIEDGPNSEDVPTFDGTPAAESPPEPSTAPETPQDTPEGSDIAESSPPDERAATGTPDAQSGQMDNITKDSLEYRALEAKMARHPQMWAEFEQTFARHVHGMGRLAFERSERNLLARKKDAETRQTADAVEA